MSASANTIGIAIAAVAAKVQTTNGQTIVHVCDHVRSTSVMTTRCTGGGVVYGLGLLMGRDASTTDGSAR